MSRVYSFTGQQTLKTLQDAVNYSRYQHGFIAKSIGQLVKKKNIKVLDFGAGIGTYSDMLRSDKRLVIECIEPDDIQAKILHIKGYRVYPDINACNERYDIIFALNVFEHIKDDVAMLVALKAHLNEGGRIIIYVPAFQLLFTQLDVLVDHYRRYRINSMKSLAQKSGLHLLSVQYCDPIGFVAALIYRLCRGNGHLNPRHVRVYDKYLFPISVRVESLTQGIFGKNVLGVYTVE